jgi:hypothetical protein
VIKTEEPSGSELRRKETLRTARVDTSAKSRKGFLVCLVRSFPSLLRGARSIGSLTSKQRAYLRWIKNTQVMVTIFLNIVGSNEILRICFISKCITYLTGHLSLPPALNSLYEYPMYRAKLRSNDVISVEMMRLSLCWKVSMGSIRHTLALKAPCFVLPCAAGRSFQIWPGLAQLRAQAHMLTL